MKRIITMLLAIVMALGISTPAFGYEWRFGKREAYVPDHDELPYKSADWAPDYLEFYMDPNDEVYKGDVALVILRIVSSVLEREGYRKLESFPDSIKNFSDSGSIYYTALEEAQALVDKNIIKGNDKNQIEFNKLMTRAEFAAIISRFNGQLLGLPLVNEGKQFKDMSSHWARNLAVYASQIGVMYGDSNGNFYPNNHMTINELATAIARLEGHGGITREDIAKAFNETFKATYKQLFGEIKIDEGKSYEMNLAKDTKIKSCKILNSKIATCRYYSSKNIIKIWGESSGETKLEIVYEGKGTKPLYVPITVTKAYIEPTGVSFKDKDITLKEGEKVKLSATIYPSNATTNIKFSSSDKSIADVSTSGIVTAYSNGTSAIYVETENGYMDECYVTVEKKVVTPDTDDKIPNVDSSAYLHVKGYNAQSYHNCNFNDKLIIVAVTDEVIDEVYISDTSLATIGKKEVNRDGNYEIPVSILSKEGDTVLTVILSNGKKLTMDFHIKHF